MAEVYIELLQELSYPWLHTIPRQRKQLSNSSRCVYEGRCLSNHIWIVPLGSRRSQSLQRGVGAENERAIPSKT